MFLTILLHNRLSLLLNTLHDVVAQSGEWWQHVVVAQARHAHYHLQSAERLAQCQACSVHLANLNSQLLQFLCLGCIAIAASLVERLIELWHIVAHAWHNAVATQCQCLGRVGCTSAEVREVLARTL